MAEIDHCNVDSDCHSEKLPGLVCRRSFNDSQSAFPEVSGHNRTHKRMLLN
jgi:hypothetical protein